MPRIEMLQLGHMLGLRHSSLGFYPAAWWRLFLAFVLVLPGLAFSGPRWLSHIEPRHSESDGSEIPERPLPSCYEAESSCHLLGRLAWARDSARRRVGFDCPPTKYAKVFPCMRSTTLSSCNSFAVEHRLPLRC